MGRSALGLTLPHPDLLLLMEPRNHLPPMAPLTHLLGTITSLGLHHPSAWAGWFQEGSLEAPRPSREGLMWGLWSLNFLAGSMVLKSFSHRNVYIFSTNCHQET